MVHARLALDDGVDAKDFISKRALREGSARNLHGDGLWSSGEGRCVEISVLRRGTSTAVCFEFWPELGGGHEVFSRRQSILG